MSTYDWDSVARRYVEHDTLPMTTFGPLGEFGEKAIGATESPYVVMHVAAGNWPFGVAGSNGERPDNDNRAAMGAGMSDVDPEGLFLAATRETQGGGYTYPRRRKGGYISTYRGRFWPLDPRASEVNIEDIAHSLAMQCRYAGHGRRFYSVAEHSVLVSRHVPQADRLAALLHDAPEAYLVDVPRPVKRELAGYKAAEERVWLAVAAAFGLSPFIPDSVHDADARIICDEMDQNMHETDPGYIDPLGVTLEFWNPERAEAEFLAEFAKLQNMRVAA